jgi:hypothetical protein
VRGVAGFGEAEALGGNWTLCKMVLGKEHDGSVRNLRDF